MKSCVSTVVVAALLFFAGNALAAEELAPGYDACMENATANVQMMQCTSKAYTHWEDILKKNYVAAQERCSVPECKEALKKMQDLWVPYMEAGTNVILQLSEGSMGKLETVIFMAEETKKQAKLLAIGLEEE